MTTKEKIAVMQAYEDGKTIQFYSYGEWEDIDVPAWNWASVDYRVKPESKLRPYKDATEQKKIDIEKACEVYRKELSEIISIFNRIGKELCGIDELGETISLEGCIKDFRKAMEE